MTDLGIAGVGDATLIASGGSALVYKALSGTGQHIAVKVLRGIRGPEVRRRFDREQSAAERLGDHPNIVPIHHSGITPAGEPYLVMPLIEGGSLHDELESSGAFPLHRAIADVSIAADAIHHAHARGVLHRDIKPGNLLRADDGSILVSDFGIARVVDAGITSATLGATTPLYAAPELLAENDASFHSEVYSLGALLYTLLAGKAAFSDSSNIWATMHRVRTEAPPPIPGVPPPVMRVVAQAMSKDAIDRPASALEFSALLATASTADDTWWPPTPTGTTELPRDLIGSASVPVIMPPLATAPPVPPLNRPVPVAGDAPAHESASFKVLASLVALVLVGGLAWWGTTSLFASEANSVATGDEPIDTSLPSPTSTTSGQDQETSAPPEPVSTPPTRLVTFTGQHFTAYLPEGWTLDSKDIDQDYGFRSTFRSDTMYMNIDTTPSEQRPPGVEILQSARDIAAGIRSASAVRTEEIEGLLMHSFTFTNRQGVESIDIFFEVDGDGYAIVAGSSTEPTAAFDTARLVALSIRSSQDP